ncbi:MAG TPA: YgcG family protein [Steroidobacteraceae bacterium]|nr:YgcG family protein [Steroidobacteraceae bacterium]
MAAILRLCVLALVFGTGSLAQAQPASAALDATTAPEQIPIPPLTARVTDLTGTLTTAQIQALVQTLQSFEARKGGQIAVLIVPTTRSETIEQFGIRLAESWKLGRKGIDDGAILIVAKNDRTVRIEVGYGLEGALNDATCKRIISEIIIPRFRKGDFEGGIRDGVDRMIRVVEGEPLPEPSSSAPGVPELRHYAPVVLLFALFLGGFLRSFLGRIPGAVITGGLLGYLAWLAAGALSVALISGLIAFVVTLIGGGLVRPLLGGVAGGHNRRTGDGGFGPGYGGFGRGYGGSGGGGFGGLFGGSSGGGFRGGGGGFGGGGASGRW